MLPLILTILCSTGITLILKHNDETKGTPIVLLVSNYFVAVIISLCFLLLSPDNTYSLITLFFGALLAFMFVFSFFAFIYTSVYVLVKQIKINRQTLLLGAVLGVPNIFSSFFLLGALVQLPAIIVYPVTNIGIIFLTTLGALIIWKEKLNIFGKWALIIGIIAIFLLSF